MTMMIRTLVCGVCGKQEVEPSPGAGHAGWGQLSGIVLDGDENPYLCPEHLAELASAIDGMKHEE